MTGTERQSAIRTQGLAKVFGKGATAFQALHGVDIDIAENEFFTLLGPSGCGKTTLLRLIAGFDFPTEGQILFQGRDIAALPPFQRPINTVFQNYALFPHMTVAQNIGFGLKMQGWDKAKITARVAEMLRPVRKDMQIELKRLQHETGITFVFVTHDQEEALAMSDRIAVMNRGRVLQVGDPRTIYNAPADRFVADFIGESNLLTGRVLGSAGPGVHRIALAGAEVLAMGEPEGPEALVMIRPEHVQVHFAATQDALSATIGETVFVGTETRLHLQLPDGGGFIALLPNADATSERLERGRKVWLSITPGTARILEADHG